MTAIGVETHSILQFSSTSYPGYSSVGVIVQEMAGQYEALSVCLYERQREDLSYRVKQGPGVVKASWDITVNFCLVGHPQTDNLISSHLEERRWLRWSWQCNFFFLPYSTILHVEVIVLLVKCTCSFRGPMFFTGGGWQGRSTTKMWPLREAELTRLDTVTSTLNSPVLQRVKPNRIDLHRQKYTYTPFCRLSTNIFTSKCIRNIHIWIYLSFHKANFNSETHLWKTCCSVLCPSLEDPSPKLHRKVTSVPTLTRQLTVTVWFCRTEAWWSSLLSFTALWTTSGNTLEVMEVRPLDRTTTTSYLHWREGVVLFRKRYVYELYLHLFFLKGYQSTFTRQLWFFCCLNVFKTSSTMKLYTVIDTKKHQHCILNTSSVSYLPGLWYLLVTVPEVVLSDLESPKCQRNSTGSGTGARARKVISVFVG